MRTQKKHMVLTILIFVLLVAALYFMFKDNYKEILGQILEANPLGIALITIMGILYCMVDGAILGKIAKNRNPKYKVWQGIENLYYGLFFKGITMATATKPAQIYLLSKQGIEPGAGTSMLMIQYVIHKFTVMLYSLIMLVIQFPFLNGTYGKYFNYLYLACAANVIMNIVLILACLSVGFHKLIQFIMDQVFKKEKYAAWKEGIHSNLVLLKKEAQVLLKNKTLLFKLVLLNILKLSFWYTIPFIAVKSVGGVLTPEDFIKWLAVTAFMNLIVGVIPAPGGIGSTEIIYYMMFGVLVGDVMAGSTMLLNRISTYYLPFLISCLFMIGIKIKNKKMIRG